MPRREPVIVPDFEPVMVPTRDPVMVPVLLARDPVIVPPKVTEEMERLNTIATRTLLDRPMIFS